MDRTDELRPLWTCPRCGKSYANRNNWHACVVVPLDAYFEDRPDARACFEAIRAAIEREGPVTVTTSRTRIEFMTRVRFAGLTVRRRGVRLALWLKRDVESPRVARVEHYGPVDRGVLIDIATPDDVDDEVVALLREAREIGDQRLPEQRRRYARRSASPTRGESDSSD